ncbi:transglycosylase SLT domain-containing protein [bacterium]|nr:transglycosylase SLT domain-containing protein [bacterium]
MIFSPVFVFQLFFSAFAFDFAGSGIEKHIEQKILYFQQFTDEEKEDFCKNGDKFSCRILFLEALKSKDAGRDPEIYLEPMSDREKSAGLYLYASEKWEEISLEKLKSYIAVLPESSAKSLYSIYLKKLYLSGRTKHFMEDYVQTANPTLTQYYVTELLKQDPEKGLAYLRTMNVAFSESFYDTLSQIVEQHSKKLSRKAQSEFKIWSLEYNFRKVRYKQVIKMSSGWFPNKNYSKVYDWRAHLYRAMSYTKRREHTQAEAIYTKLEQYLSNEELTDGDVYKFYSEYAYSEAALGKTQKANKLYLAAYERFRNNEEAAGGFLYLAADMARLAGLFDDAEKYYGEFIQNFPHAGKIELARFLNFWIDYKQGKFTEAQKLLSSIISATNEMSYDHQRASYWFARVAEKLGENEVAQDLFCTLATKIPASFYGSLAAARVKNNQIECPEIKENADEKTKFHDDEMLPETEWIVATMVSGDQNLVAKTLRNNSGIIDSDGREIDRLIASYAAKTVNNHTLAATLLKSISNFSATSKEYFKLRYTVAFEEEILAHCDFYDVSPIFVFSIARQESLFDTAAISSSYAIGLLQLLPATAQTLATHENYGKIEPRDLEKPLTNIRFGVKFLADLVKKFNGSIPLAAASYNAGPNRTMKWIANDPGRELDEFIEDIPIFQTRNYVKKVMTNYAVYHYIFYGKVYDGMNFKLPESR